MNVAEEELIEALDPKDFDNYMRRAVSSVEELRDLVFAHHAELVRCGIKVIGGGRGGVSATDTKSSADPAAAAEFHRLKIAAEGFLNACRGNY
jgi:hypothetical protein